MDVARIGADDADALLIVSSGCHGVEGYCGSGAQVALLHDDAFRAKARHAGVALLFIHALNPWGFSFGRRVTHEGVDLNRNFIDFRRPPPGNPGYDQLAAFLLPDQWPPHAGNERQLMAYGGVARHGRAAGGDLRRPVHAIPTACSTAAPAPPGASRRCAWCCASTPRAAGCSAGSTCTAAWARAASASASSPAATTTPPSTARRPGGATASRSPRTARRRRPTCTATCGTPSTTSARRPPTPASRSSSARSRPRPCCAALRYDHWVARRRDPHDEHCAAARAAMRQAFFTDTPEWKQAVLAQSRDGRGAGDRRDGGVAMMS